MDVLSAKCVAVKSKNETQCETGHGEGEKNFAATLYETL